jgi:hypothetical protein
VIPVRRYFPAQLSSPISENRCMTFPRQVVPGRDCNRGHGGDQGHARQRASSVKTIRARGRDPRGSGHGDGYDAILSDIVRLLDEGRRTTARAVNRVMTATYWAVGRRIVEHEQGGLARADYGDTVLERLAVDLTARLDRGFSRQNLQRFRQFYLTFPLRQIRPTVSSKSPRRPPGRIRSTVSSKFIGPAALPELARTFPLASSCAPPRVRPWSVTRPTTCRPSCWCATT